MAAVPPNSEEQRLNDELEHIIQQLDTAHSCSWTLRNIVLNETRDNLLYNSRASLQPHSFGRLHNGINKR